MPIPRRSGIIQLSGVRRVLLVDDQPDAAELTAMLLENHGHQVVIAHDGEAALVVAAQFRPQVAVLDIGLPVMDGYEIARRMRTLEQTSGCRLIALSGHCDELDRARSKLAGFDRHLAKPCDLESLLRAIVAREDGSGGHTITA